MSAVPESSSSPFPNPNDGHAAAGNAPSPHADKTDPHLELHIPRTFDYGSATDVVRTLELPTSMMYTTKVAAILLGLGTEGIAKLLVQAATHRDTNLVSRILTNIPCGEGESALREGGEILRIIGEQVQRQIAPSTEHDASMIDMLLNDRSENVFPQGLIISRIILDKSPIGERKALLDTIYRRCSDWPRRHYDLKIEGEVVFVAELKKIIRDHSSAPESSISQRRGVDAALPARIAACRLVEFLPPFYAIEECTRIIQHSRNNAEHAIALAILVGLTTQWRHSFPRHLLDTVPALQEILKSTFENCAINAFSVLQSLGQHGRRGVELALKETANPALMFRAVLHKGNVGPEDVQRAREHLHSDVLQNDPQLPLYTDDLLRVLIRSGNTGLTVLEEAMPTAGPHLALLVINVISSEGYWRPRRARIVFACMERGDEAFSYGLRHIRDRSRVKMTSETLAFIALSGEMSNASKVAHMRIIKELHAQGAHAAYAWCFGEKPTSVRTEALQIVSDHSGQFQGSELAALARFVFSRTSSDEKRLGLAIALRLGNEARKLYRELRKLESNDPDTLVSNAAKDLLDKVSPKSIRDPQTWPRMLWQKLGFR